MAKEQKSNNEKINITKIESNLKKYVDDEIKKELDKSNKRLIREKSKKILFRNIIILILILIIIFLLYLLKTVHYFDRFFIDTIENNNVQVEDSIIKDDEKNLNKLIDQYGHFIDNIYINEKSEYLADFYSGNLTDELKLYILINSLNLDDYIDNDYTIIDNDILKSESLNLFNDYKAKSFKYNGYTIEYISKLNSYIIDKPLKNKKNKYI